MMRSGIFMAQQIESTTACMKDEDDDGYGDFSAIGVVVME